MSYYIKDIVIWQISLFAAYPSTCLSKEDSLFVCFCSVDPI